jgi:hypothetical protein
MGLVWVIDEDREEGAWIERVSRTLGHRTRAFAGAREAVSDMGVPLPDLAFVSAGKQGERAEERLLLMEAAGLLERRVLLVAGGSHAGRLRRLHGHRVAGVLKRPLGLDILARHLGGTGRGSTGLSPIPFEV